MDVNWCCKVVNPVLIYYTELSKMFGDGLTNEERAFLHPPQVVTENNAGKVTSWTQVCWMKLSRTVVIVSLFSPLGGRGHLGRIYPLISAFETACSERCDLYGIFSFLFLTVTLWNIIFASSTAGLYNWWPVWVAGAPRLNHARLGSSACEFITFWKASRLLVFRWLLLWRGRWLSGRRRNMEQNSR